MAGVRRDLCATAPDGVVSWLEGGAAGTSVSEAVSLCLLQRQATMVLLRTRSAGTIVGNQLQSAHRPYL